MPRPKDGVSIHAKGYPRCRAGPLRDQLIHRVVASAMLGRDLKKDEEVHHRDEDKRNFHWRNLFILGAKDHGWVSNKQKYFMDQKDLKEKVEWDAFMNEQAEQFQVEVAKCRAEGTTWECQDGQLKKEWESRPPSSSNASPPIVARGSMPDQS